MLARRIIPCLDCDLGVPGGRVVKGIEFKQIRYAGVPWELAGKYYEDGADEIVFLDITASHERRETMTSVIKETSKTVFVPLAVGGGINSVEQAREVFNAGADKITVNTSALKRPELISEISDRYGNQAVVLAIDAKRRYTLEEGRQIVETEQGPCWFECSFYGGRQFTGIDAVAWASRAVSLGAGEILLTSMDRDGTYDGFDIPLTGTVAKRVNVPVIASGGCASPDHMREVFKKTDASAALAASIFHFGEWKVRNVKTYLKERGVNVRI
jgi:cyclase